MARAKTSQYLNVIAPSERDAERKFQDLIVKKETFGRWMEYPIQKAGSLVEAQLHDLKSCLVQARSIQDEIEARRVELVKPINGVVKKINAQAKAAAMPLVRFEAHGKMLVSTAQEAKAEASREAYEAEAQKAEARGSLQLAEDIRQVGRSSVSIAGDGISFRTVQQAEIVDLDQLLAAMSDGGLDQVTKTALRAAIIGPLTTALCAVARSTKGGATIPGVQFSVKQSVAIGR